MTTDTSFRGTYVPVFPNPGPFPPPQKSATQAPEPSTDPRVADFFQPEARINIAPGILGRIGEMVSSGTTYLTSAGSVLLNNTRANNSNNEAVRAQHRRNALISREVTDAADRAFAGSILGNADAPIKKLQDSLATAENQRKLAEALHDKLKKT